MPRSQHAPRRPPGRRPRARAHARLRAGLLAALLATLPGPGVPVRTSAGTALAQEREQPRPDAPPDAPDDHPGAPPDALPPDAPPDDRPGAPPDAPPDAPAPDDRTEAPLPGDRSGTPPDASAPDAPPDVPSGAAVDAVTGADPAAGAEPELSDGVSGDGEEPGQPEPAEREPGAGQDGAGEAGESAGAAGDAEVDAAARPWARGVSSERQARARAIYAQANELLHEYLLEEAMEKYREALTHWDHPAIHYNLARALDSLGRPLEADAHMQEAQRYGAAAYSELEYTQVMNFRRLLDQKLSRVTIVSEEADVRIALDGDHLLDGQGKIEKRVLPGEHLLVVRRPGQPVVTRLLDLEAGRQTRIELDAQRRWPPWQPWGVIGAGALIGVTGGLLQWRAQANMSRYHTRFAAACPAGCPDGSQPALARLRGRASWQNSAGVTALVTGGVVLVTGTVLVVLNQARSFRMELNRPLGVSVSPLLAPDGAGVTMGFEF